MKNKLSQKLFGTALCVSMISFGTSLFSCSQPQPSPECVITTPPESLQLDSFYKKYSDASGIAIVSSHRVPDSCIQQVHKVVTTMVSRLPKEAVQAMVRAGITVSVMARYEGTTDLPEYSHLAADTSVCWDLKGRWMEGDFELPRVVCAEENVLAYQIDPFHIEDRLIRKFAHAIRVAGLSQTDKDLDAKLQKLLDEALASGKYAHTAVQNVDEYWMQGVQDWFDANAEVPVADGTHNWVNTRAELREYDPKLFQLLAQYFPETVEPLSLHAGENIFSAEDPEEIVRRQQDIENQFEAPDCQITSVPGELRARLGLADFYKKYVNTNGIHILSSDRVPDSCLQQVHRTVYAMTSMLSSEVLQAITRIDTRLVVMARFEGTHDVPEHAYLANDTSMNWNLRARGLGGTLDEPITSCAEENVLGYQIDKYHAEDILVHEFSHSIHLIGILQVDPTINQQLQELLAQARAEGKYEKTYAADNFEEYWAEGVQDWFNVNAEVPVPDGKHNHVNTREELREYDPRLYALISKYFPETDKRISRHAGN